MLLTIFKVVCTDFLNYSSAKFPQTNWATLTLGHELPSEIWKKLLTFCRLIAHLHCQRQIPIPIVKGFCFLQCSYRVWNRYRNISVSGNINGRLVCDVNVSQGNRRTFGVYLGSVFLSDWSDWWSAASGSTTPSTSFSSHFVNEEIVPKPDLLLDLAFWFLNHSQLDMTSSCHP